MVWLLMLKSDLPPFASVATKLYPCGASCSGVQRQRRPCGDSSTLITPALVKKQRYSWGKRDRMDRRVSDSCIIK